MKGICVGKARVVLDISHKIYRREAILKAAEDFSHVADVAVGQKVLITPKDITDLPIIGYEFCNYLIGLAKNG